MELIKGVVAEITAIEEKNVNIRRNATLEHCFGGEETIIRWKTPRQILCCFKERINYMKGKIPKTTTTK